MRHTVILALAALCLAAPASWAQKRGGAPRGGIVPNAPAGASSGAGPTSTVPGAPGYTGSTGARPGAPGNMGSTGARPGPR